MSNQWLITMKPSFSTEWLALPPKESHQVLEKLALLEKDPTPDAKLKKHLTKIHPRLYRLRSGNYRIFYTFEAPHISLLALRRRREGTYDEKFDVEFLEGFAPELAPAEKPDWDKIFAPKDPEKTKLPEPITAELLERLRVPEICHPRLLPLETREDLFDCPGIPDEIKLRLDEYLFERPLVEVFDQPDLIANDVSDLLEFKNGNLLAFLLKLDAEQEKLVDRAIDGKGPTLVKGGPGSGKSTVALYRVRSILDRLRLDREPRVLFTTYTNALVAFSGQLLEQLVGERAMIVEVRTADSLAVAITKRRHPKMKIANRRQLAKLLHQAIDTAVYTGNALEQRAQRQTITRLGHAYLEEEIGRVIEGRGLADLEGYRGAARPGRLVGLGATQRRGVWAVRTRFVELLEEASLWTWERLRAAAARHVAAGGGPPRYDAVVVDEAQDLDPALLAMRTDLCAAPNRLFVTADANQSIYGSGFRWQDVHRRLRFQGRTRLLKGNHRSTRQIGEAAASYLRSGALEAPVGETRYLQAGPLPAVRAVETIADEVDILARFLPGAAREFRFGIGSCAVLVPTESAGRALASSLSEHGLDIEFMSGRDLDLKKPCAKIITLKSAKGLEFPIVAIAGFLRGRYPFLPKGAEPEAIDEILRRERRTLFVAMTRAMRALLVLLPADSASPLHNGFEEEVWNLGHE